MAWEGDLLEKYWEIFGNPQKNWKPRSGSYSRRGKLPFKLRQSFLSLLGVCVLFSLLMCANGCPSSTFMYFQFQMTSSIVPRASNSLFPVLRRENLIDIVLVKCSPRPWQQWLGVEGCLLPTGLPTILLPCVEGQEQGGRARQVLK